MLRAVTQLGCTMRIPPLAEAVRTERQIAMLERFREGLAGALTPFGVVARKGHARRRHTIRATLRA